MAARAEDIRIANLVFEKCEEHVKALMLMALDDGCNAATLEYMRTAVHLGAAVSMAVLADESKQTEKQ